MKLRKEFVLRALAQEVPFRELCREFGISRKTGYKWVERFHERGFEGLVDQSTRPETTPGRTSSEIALEIIRLRQAHPTWGPKKIRKLLSKKLPLESELPSLRTISRVLERVNLVRKKRRRRPADQGWMLQAARSQLVVAAPNDLWTVDFKGWWTTRDGRRCEPLTVRDAFSRYVLALRILPRSDTEAVRAVFEELFEKYGLPKAIQSDNGSPFANGKSLAGLTKLSAWWITYGIDIVRSRPGCPQDNGGHERMHADIRVELELQSAHSIRAQQKLCDDWRVEFNHIRPHEALGMQTPAEVYRPSQRCMMRAMVGGFPDDAEIHQLTAQGKFFWSPTQQTVFVSSALRYQQVGLQQMADGTLRVWFYHVLLGYFRPDPTLGKCISVLPMPRPTEANARRGDSEGDTRGDSVDQMPAVVLPVGASAWPRTRPEDAIEGDTVNAAHVLATSPSEKGDLQDRKTEAI